MYYDFTVKANNSNSTDKIGRLVNINTENAIDIHICEYNIIIITKGQKQVCYWCHPSNTSSMHWTIISCFMIGILFLLGYLTYL